MNGSSAVDVEYVPQKLFDIHLQNMRERADADKELTAERLDKFEAVIERKISELTSEVRAMNVTINTRIDKTDAVLDNTVTSLIERINDVKDAQNKWFTVFGVSLSLLTVAFTVLAFFK